MGLDQRRQQEQSGEVSAESGWDQSDVGKMPGTAILSGRFTAVRPVVGTAKANVAAVAWMRAFADEWRRAQATIHDLLC
jgi:hypothetical protein